VHDVPPSFVLMSVYRFRFRFFWFDIFVFERELFHQTAFVIFPPRFLSNLN
jgi:hypothetical protein